MSADCPFIRSFHSQYAYPYPYLPLITSTIPSHLIHLHMKSLLLSLIIVVVTPPVPCLPVLCLQLQRLPNMIHTCHTSFYASAFLLMFLSHFFLDRIPFLSLLFLSTRSSGTHSFVGSTYLFGFGFGTFCLWFPLCNFLDFWCSRVFSCLLLSFCYTLGLYVTEEYL